MAGIVQKALILLLLTRPMQTHMIFNFDSDKDIRQWQVVDDVVMGGRSSGSFEVNRDGHGVFSGRVSLENNGGFSSVRYRFKRISTIGHTKVVLRLKGDGKSYQFRMKAHASDYYSYIYTFNTSREWETIEIPLADMYPAFRGRILDIGNFDQDGIEEIGFLIGNKKAENFTLLIDSISLN